MFYPELHPDLVLYYPLEESSMTNSPESTTILHDISIYGKAVEKSITIIEWAYDKLK